MSKSTSATWLTGKFRTAGVKLGGAWTIQGIAGLEASLANFSWSGGGPLVIDASEMAALDTAGAWLLQRTVLALEQQGHQIELRGLHAEHAALMDLVSSNVTALQATSVSPAPGWLSRIGQLTVVGLRDAQQMLAFTGKSSLAIARAITRPRTLRWRTILHNVQYAGVAALPITGLLSFLMGVVIAYQGADQLNRFGANIFIVDLVSLSMLRELSPLLTAIIVAGRSGSAYAAQIGTMKVTEEIDALRTIGISAQELLVVPKILALVLALPLLTVYADIAGLLGGMIMARAQLDVGYDLFFDRLEDAISLSSFLTGVAKAPVFAVIIALVGCYQGFKVTGSAASVGYHTTVSVVQSIFLVIVADAAFSILFNWLKI